MPRYLVEVLQAAKVAEKRIDYSVRSIGSHFATHAVWHRRDGVCVGTMVVEAVDQRSALGIVPPGMRAAAHVVQLESIVAAVAPNAAPTQTDGLHALAA
jgi:hypothetical protein